MCYHTQEGRVLTEGHTGKVEVFTYTVYNLTGSEPVESDLTWKEVKEKGYNDLSRFDCMRTGSIRVWASEAEGM